MKYQTKTSTKNKGKYTTRHNTSAWQGFTDSINSDRNIINEYISAVNSGKYVSSADALRYTQASGKYRQNLKNAYDTGIYNQHDYDAELSWLDGVDNSLETSKKYAALGFDKLDSDVTGVVDNLGKGWKSREQIDGAIGIVDAKWESAQRVIDNFYGNYAKYSEMFSKEEMDGLEQYFADLSGLYSDVVNSLETEGTYYGQYSSADAYEADKKYRNKYDQGSTGVNLKRFADFLNNTEPTEETAAEGEWLENYIKQTVSYDEYMKYYDYFADNVGDVYAKSLGKELKSNSLREAAYSSDMTYEKADERLWEISSDYENNKEEYWLLQDVIAGNNKYSKAETNAITQYAKEVNSEWSNWEEWDTEELESAIAEFKTVVMRYAPEYFFEHFEGDMSLEKFKYSAETFEYEVQQFYEKALTKSAVMTDLASFKGTDLYNNIYKRVQSGQVSPDVKKARYMTADEKTNYLYLEQYSGKETAQIYYDSIKEGLNYQKGKAMANSVNNIDSDTLRKIKSQAWALAGGLESWYSGIVQAFSEEERPYSALQYANMGIKKDIEKRGSKTEKFAYDAMYTLGNMAPSVALSFIPGIGSVVGSASMGASAMGNSYKQARMQGYNHSQAMNYGALVGIAEGSLSYILGGVGKIGGKATQNLTKSLSNIDNAFLRIAVNTGKEMLSEATEEYLQETLDPVFRNLLLGEDNEIKLISEEQAYSALMGAIMSLGFGATSISSEVSANNAYMDVASAYGYSDVSAYNPNTAEGYDNLMAEVTRIEELAINGSIDPESKVAQSALKLNKKIVEGKKVSDFEIRNFLMATTEDTKTISDNAIRNASIEYIQDKEGVVDGYKIDKHGLLYRSYADNDGVDLAVDSLDGILNVAEKMVNDGIIAENSAFARDISDLRARYSEGADISNDTVNALFNTLQTVATNNDGVTELKTNNSETVNSTDPKIVETVTKNAEKLNNEGSTSYITAFNNAPEGTDVKTFDDAYNSIWFEGRYLNNTTFDTMWEKYSVYKDIISEDMAREIYEEAVDVKITEVNRSIDKAMICKGVAKGEVTGGYGDARDTFAYAIAARFGANVEITDIENGANAQYNPETGTIRLNRNIKRFTQSVIHEMMEAVLAYHADSALEIQDAVISYLKDTKGADFVKEHIDKYSVVYTKAEKTKNSKEKTINEAKSELVNDCVGQLFATEEGFKEFSEWLVDTDKVDTEQKKHILTKVKEMLNEVIQFFKKLLSVAPMNKATAAMVEMEEEGAKAIRKMALNAFDKVAQTLAEGNAEGNITQYETINIRNSLNVVEDYPKIVENIEIVSDEDAEYNKEHNTFVKISDITPDIICDKCNAPNLPMIIRYDTLYLETRNDGVFPGNYHHLGSDVMKDIFNILSDPDMILKQSNGRFVVISYDDRIKGSEGMISLEINSVKNIDDQFLYYNVVVTAFDLKKRYFKNLFSKQGAEIKYKKEDLEQVNPQLHKWLSIVNSESSNNMISENDGIVNTDFKNSLEVNEHTYNRSLLANALESVTQNEDEKKLLGDYKERIERMDKAQAELNVLYKRINELRYTKNKTAGQKVELETLRKKADELADRIYRYDRRLLELESTKVIQGVVSRARTQMRRKAAESRKKNVEGRKQTSIRHDIDKVIGRVDRLLRHGTKERNVKNDLQEVAQETVALGQLLFRDVYDNADIAEAVLRNPETELTEVTPEEESDVKRYGEILVRRRVIAKKIRELQKEGKLTEEEKADFDTERSAMSTELKEISDRLENFFKRKRNSLASMPAVKLIENLEAAYKTLQNSSDDYIKDAYNPEVLSRLDSVKEILGNTAAIDMSSVQLTEVYKAFRMVETTISNANKIFRNGKAEEMKKFVDTVQQEISQYIKEHNDPTVVADTASNWVNDFGWNNLKPIYAFERLGSAKYMELYMEAVKAEGVYAKDMEEAKNFISEQRNKYNYDNWDLEKGYDFELADGNMITLTIGDMQTIYALYKRDGEKGIEHLTIGGVKFGLGNKYKPGDIKIGKDGNKSLKEQRKLFAMWRTRNKQAKAKILTRESLKNILKTLEEYDNGNCVKYVDAMQEYLSEVMGAKGNESSRVLYGIDLFTEENYVPMKVESDYINSTDQALSATMTQVSLKNAGMTKPTKPNANTPLILDTFDDVWLGHVDQMSKYHALVLPIENLQKVFNARSFDGTNVATKEIITRAFGKSAEKYIAQYITDLNGGVKGVGVSSPTALWFSRFKKAKVAASLSVIVQQPFAVIRAMALIDPKYFLNLPQKGDYAELKKYAPIAIIKEMGGFDVGSTRSGIDYIKGAQTVGEKIDNAAMWGASVADKVGWTAIWEAVKKEQAEKLGYDVNSKDEKFLEACGERFTEVVAKTQVYDSVNARSGYMRSKNDLVKFATSFMGEPTTTINMAFSAHLAVFRAEKGTQRKAALVQLARTNTALLASTILTNAAVALVYAARDDDEDETYIEKYLQAFSSAAMDSLIPLNLIPFVKDVYSLWKGYDVERPDMTLYGDLIDSFKKFIDAVNDLESGMPWEETFRLSLSVLDLGGIPARNAVRDVEAVVRGIKGGSRDVLTVVKDKRLPISGKEAVKAIKEGIVPDKTDKELVEQAFRRFNRGNNDTMLKSISKLEERVREDILADYPNIRKDALEESVIGGTKTILKSKLRDTYQAAVEEGDNETKNNIRDFLEATGLFEDNEAINEVLESMLGEEGNNDWYQTKNGKIGKFVEYVDSKDTKSAEKHINEWVEEKTEELLTDEGYTDREEREALRAKYTKKAKGNIKSSFTSVYKPMYLEAFEKTDTKTANRIKKILLNTGLYDGDDDIKETFKSWRKDDFKDKHEDDYIIAYTKGDTKTMQKIKNKMLISKLYGYESGVNKELKKWLEKAEENEND